MRLTVFFINHSFVESFFALITHESPDPGVNRHVVISGSTQCKHLRQTLDSNRICIGCPRVYPCEACSLDCRLFPFYTGRNKSWIVQCEFACGARGLLCDSYCLSHLVQPYFPPTTDVLFWSLPISLDNDWKIHTIFTPFDNDHIASMIELYISML